MYVCTFIKSIEIQNIQNLRYNEKEKKRNCHNQRNDVINISKQKHVISLWFKLAINQNASYWSKMKLEIM